MHFLRKARSVVGKPFPNRKLLIEELMSRQGTQVAIEEEMKRSGAKKEDLEVKARQIFDVMAADTRYPLRAYLS